MRFGLGLGLIGLIGCSSSPLPPILESIVPQTSFEALRNSAIELTRDSRDTFTDVFPFPLSENLVIPLEVNCQHIMYDGNGGYPIINSTYCNSYQKKNFVYVIDSIMAQGPETRVIRLFDWGADGDVNICREMQFIKVKSVVLIQGSYLDPGYCQRFYWSLLERFHEERRKRESIVDSYIRIS